jgi:hypothetical protein
MTESGQNSLDLVNISKLLCSDGSLPHVRNDSLSYFDLNKSSLIVTLSKIEKDEIVNHVTLNELPVATMISCIFMGLSLFLIFCLKIISMSSDQFLYVNNKNDLILFKSAPFSQKNQGLANRKMFENEAVRAHNLKALAESGFDMSLLEFPRSLQTLRKKLKHI